MLYLIIISTTISGYEFYKDLERHCCYYCSAIKHSTNIFQEYGPGDGPSLNLDWDPFSLHKSECSANGIKSCYFTTTTIYLLTADS